MRRFHLSLALAVLLAACIPAQVVRSPDGRLAYRLKKGIAILKPDLTLHKRFDPLKVDGQECEPVWLSWSPDGKLIAFVCSLRKKSGSLCILNPGDGGVRLLATHEGGIWFPHWAPDGNAISYVLTGKGDWDDAFESELRLHSMRDGSARVLAERCGLEHAWAPDGKSIFTVVHEEKRLSEDAFGMGSLVRIDLGTADPEKLAHVAYGPFTHVRFDPVEARVLFCSPRLPAVPVTENARYALFAFDLETGSLAALSEASDHVFLTVPSPSGRRQLVVAPRPGEILEGEIRVSGEGIEGVRALKNVGDEVFPFWLDEDRIGFQREEKRIAVHNLRSGKTEDVTERFAGFDGAK
ncbi:MAG: TolB family protein [Planctomycetota bacterium]|jgi:dipeptidyl aminopeptidase/acylaminoacyl peptidase